MKFEIFQSEKSGEYYFRLKAKNGQIILSSEGYKQKSGAKNGIESVMKNAPMDERFIRKEASNGKHYFSLVAGNNQPIGKSQMYASKDGMEKGIDSVQNNSKGAEIVDLTTEEA